MTGVKLAHLLSLFSTQNSEQVDFGFHHGVNGFGFQVAHFIGQGPQTGLVQFAGVHELVHFQMNDLMVSVPLNPLFTVFELFVFDLSRLCFGQAKAVPKTQDVFKRIALVAVPGLAVAAAVFFGMRSTAMMATFVAMW